jgi:hypothetical protein
MTKKKKQKPKKLIDNPFYFRPNEVVRTELVKQGVKCKCAQ